MVTNVALEQRARWTQEAAVRSLLRKARSRRAKRSRQSLKLTMTLCLLAFCALTLAARHARMASLGYSVVSLKGDLERLESENAWLRAEIARLSSPQRIEKIAVGTLGMQRPEEMRVLRKDSEKVAALLAKWDSLAFAWAGGSEEAPGVAHASGSGRMRAPDTRRD